MSAFQNADFVNRWRQLNLVEQLANVGSEVERLIAWTARGNQQFAANALHRSLDLLDLTVVDPRWKGGKRKELTRLREFLCDAYVGENVYGTIPEFLSRYFQQFATAAQRGR